MTSSIPILLFDLFCLFLFLALGALAVRFLAPGADALEVAAAGFPIGTGLLTYSVFLLSWAGVTIRLITWAEIYAALGLLLAFGFWYRSRRGGGRLRLFPLLERPAGPRWQRWAVWIAVGLVFLVSMWISVGRAYTLFDASAVWAPKGYGIALEGTIFAGRDWGGGSLDYPLNISLLISFFQLADGDVLPGGKLVFPLFFMAILIGSVAFWRKQRVPGAWVLVGTLVLATVPEMFRHSTYGYINIPGSAYLVLGTLWGILGMVRGSRDTTAVAGLLLALGSWTRVEGLVHAIVIIGAIGAVWLVLRPGRFYVVWLAAPVALLGGLWVAFAEANGFAASQPGGALTAAIQGWLHGDLNLHSIRLILGFFRRELFHLETWGFLFPMAIVAALLHTRRFIDRAIPEMPTLLVATLATGLTVAGLFYIGSYARGDLIAWMGRGFPRAFFPAAMLLAVLAVSAAGISSDEPSTAQPGLP